MAQIADALRTLLENSEDLSSLPALVAKVEELESGIFDYQTRISKLQEINRSYLAQIPIPGKENEGQEQKPEEPTLADAKAYLIEALGGNK